MLIHRHCQSWSSASSICVTDGCCERSYHITSRSQPPPAFPSILLISAPGAAASCLGALCSSCLVVVSNSWSFGLGDGATTRLGPQAIHRSLCCDRRRLSRSESTYHIRDCGSSQLGDLCQLCKTMLRLNRHMIHSIYVRYDLRLRIFAHLRA